MGGPGTCSDEEFKALFNSVGATETARILEMTERGVYKRRRNLEGLFGEIVAPTRAGIAKEYPHRQQLRVQNGAVLVGGDFHIWPAADPVCLRAFKKFARDIEPAAVILNGDCLK